MLRLGRKRRDDEPCPLRASLSGEVDHARGVDLGLLIEAFNDSGCADLELDVSDVSFIDSAGLCCFVTLHGIAEQRGGRLHLVGTGRQMLRVLTISGVGPIIGVPHTSD